MNRPDKMRRRVHRSIAAVVVLCGLLALTTYALVASLVSVEGHLFETAQVKIELNGGKVIFDAGDMNIEPGYSIRRNFTVENRDGGCVLPALSRKHRRTAAWRAGFCPL